MLTTIVFICFFWIALAIGFKLGYKKGYKMGTIDGYKKGLQNKTIGIIL